jgi:peptidoglycan/LPS O-acetylase OafA/YrhL
VTLSQTSGEALETPRRRLPYLPALEGLRGFAIFAVMAVHTGIYVAPGAVDYLVPGALIVMPLFFGLSGFLITVLLLIEFHEHGRIDVVRFLKNRARRLYPPLLLMLGAHGLLVWYYQRPLRLEFQQDLWIVLQGLNYKYSIHGQDPVLGWDVKILWSLTVEAQFYIVWPILLALLLNHVRAVKRIVTVLVVLAGVATFARSLEYHWWQDWEAVYYRTEGRFDAFFLGGGLAFLWMHRRLPMAVVRRLSWGCWIVFLVGFWLVRVEDGFMYSWGFLLFTVASMIMIGASLDNGFIISRWLSWRPLRLAGRVSYSFYIVHMQVFFWVVLERSYLSAVQKIALSWSVTLVAGSAVFWFAERPFLSPRRKRLAPT